MVADNPNLTIPVGPAACHADAKSDEKPSSYSPGEQPNVLQSSLEGLIAAISEQTLAFNQLATSIALLAQAIMEQNLDNDPDDDQQLSQYLDGGKIGGKH